MDEAQKMVREFHEEFDIHVAESPSVPDAKTMALRERLIQEEFDELKEAMKAEIFPALRKNSPIFSTSCTARPSPMGSTWPRCSGKCSVQT